MPTYGYKCLKCGKRFEKFQSIVDDPISACPKCGGAVEREIGAGGAIIVKGGADSVPGPSCGRETPCCGRDVPCDSRPCG